VLERKRENEDVECEQRERIYNFCFAVLQSILHKWRIKKIIFF